MLSALSDDIAKIPKCDVAGVERVKVRAAYIQY
jgi:hypothetical protein